LARSGKQYLLTDPHVLRNSAGQKFLLAVLHQSGEYSVAYAPFEHPSRWSILDTGVPSAAGGGALSIGVAAYPGVEHLWIFWPYTRTGVGPGLGGQGFAVIDFSARPKTLLRDLAEVRGSFCSDDHPDDPDRWWDYTLDSIEYGAGDATGLRLSWVAERSVRRQRFTQPVVDVRYKLNDQRYLAIETQEHRVRCG